MNFSLIIVAAGSGTRLGHDIPKQYISIGGQSILQHTLNAFIGVTGLKDICIVMNESHESLFYAALPDMAANICACYGGETRQDSVRNGLNALDLNDDDIVLIHDAARPFVDRVDIQSLIDAMQSHKAATLAHPVADTLRYVDDHQNAGQTVLRDHLWAVQTPQAFHAGVLKRAHAQNNQGATDDTALVSASGIPVHFIKGNKRNVKITQKEDLDLAQHLLPTETHIGTGFDVHAFDEASLDVKSVRLCGVDVAYDRALMGHSDADVGLHALTDAVLGAIGAGDIGMHFPPSNDDFKGMDSAIFLQRAIEIMRDKSGFLVNADVTLICERPKIGKYREAMVKRIAEIMGVAKHRVNIKATTTEKLGFTGRKEGIAAQAAVSIQMPQKDD